MRAKKDDIEEEQAKRQALWDKTTARINQLTKEIADDQASIKELLASQQKRVAMRSEEHQLFLSTEADQTQGIDAVQSAFGILRSYYNGEHSHNAAAGESTGIIGMLEVVQSDMTKSLAELHANEGEAQSEFVRESQENEVARTGKEQDVKYKTKERTTREQTKAEVRTDLDNGAEEHEATSAYLTKVEERCIKKAETYESRRDRIAAEIEGLKQALATLNTRYSLLQEKSCHQQTA
eukprot:NODE_20812_length_781_cov_4.314985.p2 GENE.NODE_20812_length_781_cov_4.314985~~NODE_20812_length_781_cov_4.314985.p2  ORF type:complete len:237 (+),score=106.30 NODE_20812_length_781_cov_4.314985:33-743(+)